MAINAELIGIFDSIVNLFRKKRNVLSVQDFKTAISSSDAQLMDIRMITEYRKGHIEGAIHNDFYLEEFLEECDNFDKEKPLYIYCRRGKRSEVAAVKLKEYGFRAVYELEGGYTNYE